jgi:hypothetical protein
MAAPAGSKAKISPETLASVVKVEPGSAGSRAGRALRRPGIRGSYGEIHVVLNFFDELRWKVPLPE